MALTVTEANAVSKVLGLLAGKGRWSDLEPTAPVSETFADEMLLLAEHAGKTLQVGSDSIITLQEAMNFLDEWREEGEYDEDVRPVETVDTRGRT